MTEAQQRAAEKALAQQEAEKPRKNEAKPHDADKADPPPQGKKQSDAPDKPEEKAFRQDNRMGFLASIFIILLSRQICLVPVWGYFKRISKPACSKI